MPPEDIGKKKPNRDVHYWPRRNNKKPWLPGIAAFINAYRNEKKTDREQDRREYRGNRSIEIWTLIFVICTTVGIFIQACILNSSDRAMHEFAQASVTSGNAAQKAAEAATRAVETSIATERSRLFVGSVSLKRSNDKDPSPTISFQIINLGKTGALMTAISNECAVVPIDIDISPTYNPKRIHPAMSIIAGASTFVVPPGYECALDNPITDDDFIALAEKKKIILFKGFIRFQDVFGEIFTKHFGLYGYGDKPEAFFGITGADAYNAETKDQ
jgi:hypothetical protein